MTSRRTRAAELRDEIEASAGRLRLRVSTLLAYFAQPRLTPEAVEAITEELAGEEIQVEPALDRVAADGSVYLVLADRAIRPRVDEPERTSYPSPRTLVDEGAAGISTVAATIGALAVAGVAALAGFGAFWLYGVAFLGAGAVVALVLHAFRGTLARIFLPGIRWAWLRSVVFGVAPASLLCALIAFALVLPVSEVRAANQREYDARQYLALAEAAIESRDVERAARYLIRSRARDQVNGQAQAERRLSDLRDRIAEEDRQRDAYAHARSAFANGRYAIAIDGMEALDGYRDADMQATRYRRTAIRRALSRARTELGARPRVALRFARQALAYGPTAEGERLIRRAEAELAARRAAALERQRRLAAERAARRAAEEAARQAGERERQRREEAALQELYDSYDDSYDSGGSGNWCGASRDGDGDGIWCEGR